MRTRPKKWVGRKRSARRSLWKGARFGSRHFYYLLTLLIAALLTWSSYSMVTAAQQPQPGPGEPRISLVYLQDDRPNGSHILTNRSVDDSRALSTTGQQETVTGAIEVPSLCGVLGMYTSAQRHSLAVEVTCEGGNYVQVVEAATGRNRALGIDPGTEHYFLSWSPFEDQILLRVREHGNPHISLIDVATGVARQMPVPATTYDLALSSDGQHMIYSTTAGLGFGSQTWIADIDGQNARRVLADPAHIIAFARWSPQGDGISYIRMPDTNVPFTQGELWVMNGAGSNRKLMGPADAGHGYRPSWSPDGKSIAFVGRESPGGMDGDPDQEFLANNVANQLDSNIYRADLAQQSVAPVTQFEGALTEAPVWSPDGDLLTFSSTASGGMEVWIYDRQENRLNQVTRSASARHPVWLTTE